MSTLTADNIIVIGAVGGIITLLGAMTYRKLTEPREIIELVDAPINRGREGDSGTYLGYGRRPLMLPDTGKKAYDAEISEFYRRINDRDQEQSFNGRPMYRTQNTDVTWRNFVGYNSL